MKKKFDIITIGGATEDLSFLINDYRLLDNRREILAKKLLAIEYGAKTIVDESFVEYGGGAANLAMAIKQCGLSVASWLAVGSDRRGQDIIDNLKSHKIDTGLCQIIDRQQSAVSVVLIGQDGEHTIIAYRGANDHLSITSSAAKQLASDWLYVSSLSGKIWLKNLTAIFKSHKKIAWNPGQAQLTAGFKKLRPFLEKTDLLIINQDEALQLLASHPFDNKQLADYGQNMKKLIQRLWCYGPKIVVITADSRGAWSYDGQTTIHQPALPVKKIIDTTGVGDAFGGTLLGCLIKTNSLKKSLYLAAKQAAAAISQRGAQSGLINISKLIR